MSAKPPFVSEPRCYQVTFDATIPNVHPAALPGERQRVALSRVVTAWDALDAANQIKMECERAYRDDKNSPHWKALNGVTPYWEAEFGGGAKPVLLPGSTTLERILEGARVAKEHAVRNIGDYGAKGSNMNEAHWMGFRGGVEAMQTIVETVFSLPNASAMDRPDGESKPPHVDPAYAIEEAFVAQKLRETYFQPNESSGGTAAPDARNH